MTLTVGSLFSGIGGLELGLERAGMRTVWQVESDECARKVLAKHWPRVKRFNDVKTVHGFENCNAWCDGECLDHVDLICGGFPCQDISVAGKRAGIDGERSGLWSEFARIIRELRPRFVLVENVAALLVRGMGRVLGDLAELGFNAEWSVLPACALGAPHERERLFIVAHANGFDGRPWLGFQHEHNRQGPIQPCSHRAGREEWLAAEPDTSRMADGVPAVVDRLRCLGNAVVPQVAEFIGRRIMEAA